MADYNEATLDHIDALSELKDAIDTGNEKKAKASEGFTQAVEKFKKKSTFDVEAYKEELKGEKEALNFKGFSLNKPGHFRSIVTASDYKDMAKQIDKSMDSIFGIVEYLDSSILYIQRLNKAGMKMDDLSGAKRLFNGATSEFELPGSTARTKVKDGTHVDFKSVVYEVPPVAKKPYLQHYDTPKLKRSKVKFKHPAIKAEDIPLGIRDVSKIVKDFRSSDKDLEIALKRLRDLEKELGKPDDWAKLTQIIDALIKFDDSTENPPKSDTFNKKTKERLRETKAFMTALFNLFKNTISVVAQLKADVQALTVRAILQPTKELTV